MATKILRLGDTQVKRGGRKGHEWTQSFTPGHGSLLLPKDEQQAVIAAIQQARRAQGKAAPLPGPRGSTDFVIPNLTNPMLRIIAEDVAVRAGGLPLSTPTVGSGYFTAITLGTVVATTGQLAAGVYRVEVTMGYNGAFAAGKEIRCEHRNAADSGLIHTLGMCPSMSREHFVFERVVIAQNERIRIISGAAAAGAGETVEGQVRAYLLLA